MDPASDALPLEGRAPARLAWLAQGARLGADEEALQEQPPSSGDWLATVSVQSFLERPSGGTPREPCRYCCCEALRYADVLAVGTRHRSHPVTEALRTLLVNGCIWF